MLLLWTVHGTSGAEACLLAKSAGFTPGTVDIPEWPMDIRESGETLCPGAKRPWKKKSSALGIIVKGRSSNAVSNAWTSIGDREYHINAGVSDSPRISRGCRSAAFNDDQGDEDGRCSFDATVSMIGFSSTKGRAVTLALPLRH